MVTTVGYKVIDVSPHDEDALASLEDLLNHQVEEGWELVTSVQRTHKALQVGSTITPVPGLVSTMLVFKRAHE
jgi:nitrate reductase NapAB chaperone NapD